MCHLHTNHHKSPYIRRHTCTHTQLPVAHNHSIKQGAVSMGVAAEVPLVQCAEITAGCRQTQPEILLLLLLHLLKKSMHSCKLQAAADFSLPPSLSPFASLVKPLSDFISQRQGPEQHGLIYRECAFFTLTNNLTMSACDHSKPLMHL